ncbi:hypothetical protein AAFF_G00012280 [Aldrovandia affinis]|uniref:Uncharacterized protein n=1 Tax=Aldrovandia affinis TaxID=143900 RepID=A0AAD7S6M2_9TELE|nr:hypothetical protein AAFF_G00012280 [Aldrovandia affinis]
MDAPSSFFFDLKKPVAQRKHMACIRLPAGMVTTDPAEMRKHAVWTSALPSMGRRTVIWTAAELLQGFQHAALDSELRLEELTTAAGFGPCPWHRWTASGLLQALLRLFGG